MSEITPTRSVCCGRTNTTFVSVETCERWFNHILGCAPMLTTAPFRLIQPSHITSIFFWTSETIFSRFFPFSKIFQKREKVICWPNQWKLYSILPVDQLNSTLFNRNFTYIVRKSIYTDKGASIFRDFMIS